MKHERTVQGIKEADIVDEDSGACSRPTFSAESRRAAQLEAGALSLTKGATARKSTSVGDTKPRALPAASQRPKLRR